MSTSSFTHKWLGFSSRIALLLGLGAISVVGAEAATVVDARSGGDSALVPQQSAKALSETLIWQDNGRIYVSEAGKPAEELHFGSGPEAGFLRQMLERADATSARPYTLRDRIILVGAGGSGFNWDATPPSDKPNKTKASATSSS